MKKRNTDPKKLKCYGYVEYLGVFMPILLRFVKLIINGEIRVL